jgi:hypothetical protein
MMTFKSFDKSSVLNCIKKYGFTQMDDDAFVRLVLVIEVLVYNILNNVRHVSSHLNIKVISKKHLLMVADIMKEYKRATSAGGQKGGAHVLPSEYFGLDSGRYYATGDVALSSEQSIDATADFARPAMVYQSAGALATVGIVCKDNLKYFVQHYLSSKHLSFRISSVANTLIIDSLNGNLALLLSACKKEAKGGKLTLRLLGSLVNKTFPHMAYHFKNM